MGKYTLLNEKMLNIGKILIFINCCVGGIVMKHKHGCMAIQLHGYILDNYRHYLFFFF